jgi:Predicted membrane protein
MMQTALLYVVTAVVFLGLDVIGIRFLIRPVFERHIGHLLAEPLRFGPAALFYLAYVAGILWFVSLSALKSGAPVQALVGGMVLGLMCYGTYEMTNYATLADWSWRQVVIDSLWGMALTGFAAWAGVAVLSVSGRLA